MPVDKLPGGRANGGRARMAKLSPEQRRELAVMGAKKRWEGKPKKVKPEKIQKRAKRTMSTYTEQEREVMKRVLRDTMSEFSEDFWSAGWYTGCEYVFWAKANDDKEVAAVLPTYPILDDEDKWLLLFASKVAGGWWAWDNDNAFLLMSDWESRYGKWREALLKEARERAEREKEFLEKPVQFPKELPLDEKISLVLQRFLDELPERRDWLDPELEHTAKYVLSLKKAETQKQAAQANTSDELKYAFSEMIDYVLSIPFVSGPDGAKLVSDIYVTALRSMAMEARAALAAKPSQGETQKQAT